MMGNLGLWFRGWRPQGPEPEGAAQAKPCPFFPSSADQTASWTLQNGEHLIP